ncbi:MAG: PQQ-like beta-propeller repeat protein [Rickettsiales bacterium]|nr:PQQ-like beta-propeller repeat protein [Rickettsiales bacterium]
MILRSSLITLLSLWLFSCESDQTYDKKNAVDAFIQKSYLKPDSEISLYGITIPEEKINDSWESSSSSKNSQNQNIKKNFSLNKKRKITLDKDLIYWHFYRGNRSSRYFYKPVIVNNISYSLDSSGILRAIDLNQEKKIFQKRLFPRKLLQSYQHPKITYFDNKIFAIAGSNKIVSASAKDGSVIWQKNISSIPISAPLVESKRIFILTNDNKIYCLNQEDGNLIWIQSAIYKPTAIFGSPDLVTKGNLLFAAFSSGEIYAIKKEDGEIIWSNNLNITRAINSDFYLNDIDATPVIDGDKLYVIGNGGLIAALNIKNGEYEWKREVAGITNFWLSGNYIFVINNDNKLLAIRKRKGRIKWISDLPDYKKKDKPKTKYIYNGIAMIGSKLVISSAAGKVIIVDPYKGQILKEIKIAKKIYHEPIIVGDKFYFYAIDNYIAKLIAIK